MNSLRKILLANCLLMFSIQAMEDNSIFEFDQECSPKKADADISLISKYINSNDDANLKSNLENYTLKLTTLNRFIILAIDNLMIGHYKPEVNDARFNIVKLLFKHGASTNYIYQNQPLLIYVINTFIDKKMRGEPMFEDIFRLVKLFIENNVDLFLEYETQGSKITVLSSINDIYRKYDGNDRPWVKTLRQITDFLNEQL